MDIQELVGKTFYEVSQKTRKEQDTLEFIGEISHYYFTHDQSCCENVRINDIIGDLNDLEGEPILSAEVVTESGDNDDYGTHTWTFYKFATIKGYVTVRWLGESNGYYSEEVEMFKQR